MRARDVGIGAATLPDHRRRRPSPEALMSGAVRNETRPRRSLLTGGKWPVCGTVGAWHRSVESGRVIAGLVAVEEGEDCGDASVETGVVRVETQLHQDRVDVFLHRRFRDEQRF